ncbi:MAG: hydroxymethylglutaryl-CoA lyase, partial [Novosphingobium sp.]
MSTAPSPTAIEFVEVGPRDGLQNEKTLISTADKLALIQLAIGAGARRIEVTSFVNPKKVPQMADADAVCAGLPLRDDVTYIGLVMNLRGAERALATGRIDQLGAVCVATDRFAMANQGQTSDESVEAAKAIVALAK